MCIFSAPKVRSPAPPPVLPPPVPPSDEDNGQLVPLIGEQRTVSKKQPKRGKQALTIALRGGPAPSVSGSRPAPGVST